MKMIMADAVTTDVNSVVKTVVGPPVFVAQGVGCIVVFVGVGELVLLSSAINSDASEINTVKSYTKCFLC